MFRLRLLLPLLIASSALATATPARQSAVLVSDYKGKYPDAFREEFDRVRLLTHEAQVEVSARLGLLQYQEGFVCPLTIRFEDSASIGIDNVLAYVRLNEDDNHRFSQELVINLSATRRHPASALDRIFIHEMTHAVMNDAIGGKASMKIPHWVQEGIAQYITDEGEERLRNATKATGPTRVGSLLCDLEGPYSANAYSQYYLGIRYLYETYSSNSVQAFVRLLIAGKSTQDALEEATGVPWDRFQKDLRVYSFNTLHDLAAPSY